MNTDGTGFHTCKECHKTECLWNHTATDHKEGEQLEDRRSVGASSCNSGDGTDQSVQSFMFMIMMMMMLNVVNFIFLKARDWGGPWKFAKFQTIGTTPTYKYFIHEEIHGRFKFSCFCMGVKLGPSTWERNVGWGCSTVRCRGRYFGLTVAR